MSRRKHFSLLVVRGDGTRVLRFNFPKRLVLTGLATLVVTSAVAGVLLTDWLHLRRITREQIRDAARRYLSRTDYARLAFVPKPGTPSTR